VSQRYRILIYMAVSIFLGSLPWYNFSAVAAYIAVEKHLTTADIGLIISAFQIGYVLVVVITSWLADRIGPRKVITTATLLAGLCSMSFAFFADSFASILILRILSGVASGAIYVPGLALLSQWFAPHERARALSAYTGALIAAYAGGYFIASPIAANYGWRYGIFVTSVPALFGFLINLLLVKEHTAYKEELATSKSSSSSAPNPRTEMLSIGVAGMVAFFFITISYMGHMWELFAFWGWLGPFLVSSFVATGMETHAATSLGGQIAALIILVGVPSSILWGIAADKLGRIKAIVIASIFSLVADCLFGFLYGKAVWLTTIIGLWIGFWAVADTAIYKVLITEIVPASAISTVLGIQSVSGFGMTVIAPAVFGSLLQSYNGRVPSMEAAVWWPSFLSLGIPAIIAPVFAVIFLCWVKNKRLSAN
jgi:MFS family permease